MTEPKQYVCDRQPKPSRRALAMGREVADHKRWNLVFFFPHQGTEYENAYLIEPPYRSLQCRYPYNCPSGRKGPSINIYSRRLYYVVHPLRVRRPYVIHIWCFPVLGFLGFLKTCLTIPCTCMYACWYLFLPGQCNLQPCPLDSSLPRKLLVVHCAS